MDKLYVVARDRSVLVDPNLTLREVVKYLDNNGQIFSLRRTLQLYGLTFVEQRSFSSKYRNVFELTGEKTMWDIQVKDLEQYKQELFVSSFRMK